MGRCKSLGLMELCFDMCINYLGPVSCFSPLRIPSGHTISVDCSGWGLEGHSILVHWNGRWHSWSTASIKGVLPSCQPENLFKQVSDIPPSWKPRVSPSPCHYKACLQQSVLFHSAPKCSPGVALPGVCALPPDAVIQVTKKLPSPSSALCQLSCPTI